MKVLVTGHHGYIGSITVPVLQEAGHEVTGLDVKLYEGCDLYPADGPPATLDVDVRDVQPQDLEGFDAVVHLAALSNDPLGDLDRELTMAINYEATVRVASAAKEAGVRRFVFASSCSMYGAADGDRAVDESAPLQPLTAYAESKVRSEEALADLTSDEFAPVFMRNATAYGASPRLRLDIVLNNLVGWALTSGAVRILSDGTPWRPLVHVEDIARATVAVLEAPEDVVRGEAFNVGRDDENYQVRELAEIAQGAVGDVSVEFGGSGDPDPRSYRVDFGKFKAAFPEAGLSWTAQAGAQELTDAYRAAAMTFDDFDGDRFTRLKRLRELMSSGRLDGDLRRT
ncbi:MAG TPA: SDR family oxidoreductase [Gaiellaceae bacterium]